MSVRPPTAAERLLLRHALAAIGRPPLVLELWNGEELRPSEVEPLGRVRLRSPAVLHGLVRSPQVGFGDAYCRGELEVEGDLARLLEIAFRAGYGGPQGRPLGALARWRHRRNTRKRARANVHHHYDLGNDFYALWLDEQMVYTCAYFPHPAASLEEAQRAKLDLVCRKLRLREGERVVEAGCGWGALALHMARHYGVRVRAFNVSGEQVEWAREQARRQGLADRVEFVLDDYREIREPADVFVSVGMLEHVGPGHYPALGRVIDAVLPPEGRGLLHFIGHTQPTETSPWLAQRIFPGSYMPALSEVLPLLETRQLAVVDVENLRLHYARTLEHWLERFEKAHDRVVATYDAFFARMWRLYLASSIAAFRSGSCQLWQVLFARQGATSLPLTRDDIYSGGST